MEATKKKNLLLSIIVVGLSPQNWGRISSQGPWAPNQGPWAPNPPPFTKLQEVLDLNEEAKRVNVLVKTEGHVICVYEDVRMYN